MDSAKLMEDFKFLADLVAALGQQHLLESQHSEAAVDLLETLQPLIAKLSGCAPFASNSKSEELYRSLHSTVVEVGRSATTCFVSQRNSVVDHEVVKCVLFLSLAVRTFLSKVLRILGVQSDEGVSACQESEMDKSGGWSLLPHDLDGCSLYHTFSRSMDCFGKLGRGRIRATPDQDRRADTRASALNWEQESVVGDCQAVAEAVDRNLKALDSSVNYLKVLLASTADGIEESLVSKKCGPSFVVMAQLRDKFQAFLEHGLAARTGKQGGQVCPSVSSSSDAESTEKAHDLPLKAVEVSHEAGISGLGQDGTETSQRLCKPDETLSCQIDAFHEEVEQVKERLLSRNGPMLVAVHGKEGLGKTSLAALVCCNEAVMDRFLGGIYWVSLGRFPDLVSLQNNLLEDITGIRGNFQSIDVGIARLSLELAGRLPSLLVIDDVRRVEDLNAFSLYEDSLRGKYLVTLQDSRLLDGADKDDFILHPRSEQQAATLFHSCLRSPCSSSPELDAEILKYVKVCNGVPLLIHSLSSSFCETRHMQKLERLSVRMARNVGTDERRVDDPNQQHPISRAVAEKVKPSGLLSKNTVVCYPSKELSPEEERLLDEKDTAKDEQAVPHQDMGPSRPQERETVDPRDSHGAPPTALPGSGERSTNEFTTKARTITGGKIPYDDSHDVQKLEDRDNRVTSQDLFPLLHCFDSLSAIHPVLLDRYLDLAAFPKGEYVSSRRIENVWGAGRVLNHSYTLVVLGLFASRALVEWRFESAPVQAAVRNIGYSMHWRLPAVFYDLARFVIKADNGRTFGLQNVPETVTGWSAQDNRRTGNQDLALENAVSTQRSGGPSPSSYDHSGVSKGEGFDSEDISERICHAMVRDLCSKEPGKEATLSDEGQNRSWTTALETAAISQSEKGKGTACLKKPLLFSPLRCRLFSPDFVQDQFPLGWTTEPIANTAEKLSLDRAAVSHLPESLSFSSLRIALIGNNAVVKQIPSHTFARMPSLLVLELKGCSALKSVPKAISSLQSLKVLDLSGCSSLQNLPTSIGQLTNLRELRAADCISLGCLPQSACSLASLELLDLSYCSKLQYLPTNLGCLSSLRYLYLRDCWLLQCLPTSTSLLTKVLQIDMTGCSSLQYAPSYLNQLRLLANSQKVRAMAVPPGLWKLPNLEVLQLCAVTHLTFLPSAVARLKNIRHLNFSGCRNLEYLPEDIGSLTLVEDLDLSCTALRKLPSSLEGLTNLQRLSLRDCPRLLSLPSTISSLPSLKSLDLSHCWDLIVIPPSVGEPNSFKALSHLDMGGCSFQSLPAFSVGACPELKNLNLSDCVNLTSLPPTIRLVKSLSMLKLDGCRNLQSLEGLGLEDLASLSHLSLRNCTGINSLPGLQLLQLKYLDVSGCPVSPFPEVLQAQAKDGKLKLVRWGAIWQE